MTIRTILFDMDGEEFAVPGNTVDEVIQTRIEHNSSPNTSLDENNKEITGPSYFIIAFLIAFILFRNL